jgi:hypothetical protein
VYDLREGRSEVRGPTRVSFGAAYMNFVRGGSEVIGPTRVSFGAAYMNFIREGVK